MTKTNKAAKRNQAKAQYLDDIKGVPLHGEVITWSAGGPHPFAKVKAALTSADLDPNTARARLPRHAWSRASKKLSEARVIDFFKEQDSELIFQFSKKFFKDSGIEYSEEAKVSVNKETGKVSCPKHPNLETSAQAALDACMDERTTADITGIVQKLFEKNGDLIPIRDQGGAYFVAKHLLPFVAKIEDFLTALGGKVRHWPIAMGSKSGDTTVTESVQDYVKAMVDELMQTVATFGEDTRKGSLEKQAEKIKELKGKLETYSFYTNDISKACLKSMEEADKKLVEMIEKIATAPPTKKPTAGAGKDAFGSRLGSNVAKVNTVLNGEFKNMATLAKDAGVVGTFYSHMANMVAAGLVEEKEKTFRLSEEGKRLWEASEKGAGE